MFAVANRNKKELDRIVWQFGAASRWKVILRHKTVSTNETPKLRNFKLAWETKKNGQD